MKSQWKSGWKSLVAGEEVAQDEGLEEPGGVGEVPFGGAGLGAGLDHQVLGRERRGERERGGADGSDSGSRRPVEEWTEVWTGV